MSRAYYSDSIEAFLQRHPDHVLGILLTSSEFSVELPQRFAWQEQVRILQQLLVPYSGQGNVYFEYAVPRLGKRIDVVALIRSTLFLLEFKVGDQRFTGHARDQVWDYALDLKNFHESSHDKVLVPVLVATAAPDGLIKPEKSAIDDGVFRPLLTNERTLPLALRAVLEWAAPEQICAEEWEAGRYKPTPTIIEAAMALYAEHGVAEISRSDAGVKNLTATSAAIEKIVSDCRAGGTKAICFVTGVPGAGKTLVGLNIATKHAEKGELHSVFLSGNGPLVAVMQEALARDQVRRASEVGGTLRKTEAKSRVKAFIQNVHHFRDEYLRDGGAPSDHIAVFDEAQRAWNLEQTASFMQRKKNRPGFSQSEPEFLISCLDRHKDWAVVVCLVGGGQEINTGEAGISEWVHAVRRSFPHWHIHISPELEGNEYAARDTLKEATRHALLHADNDLHLAVSVRSFRAEHLSTLVKKLLDLDGPGAREMFLSLQDRYPIMLCRSVPRARAWIREQARGSERYGIVVSSQAQRLRPHAIHVKAPVDPVHWFLHDKDDVRSSYYLEDVATEFHVQGLELDWTCVVWDGDFRHNGSSWEHHSFVGSRWQRILAQERRGFQKNAYRVLLTRARQGMVIVVPEGDESDATRSALFYDGTFNYLSGMGFPVLA
ncbi:DUF2075 domain-containing protein [Caenimonas sedimenti]|uniref:DUF2075 domain-containing protein n=1 Tax=Caenimonas sedimenti TaxID=2596921 RepID=A0A562ZSK2_9BURK|nr:DUF2075 domain-containing protein [Caenimonas sedimenti]TWO71124.1 DUF2075 domain-containing protein [Caenimonas sedimenti]